MATNLLISTPGVEYNASIETHTAEDTLHRAENATRAPRSTYFETSAAVTNSQIDFDLETGNTATPDHLIWCRYNTIRDRDTADPSITISGDDNSAFSSAQTFTEAAVAESELVGPWAEDFIMTFTPSGGERYWRIETDTTASEVHLWVFVRLGTFLDMGRDPVYNPRLSFQRVKPNERRARWVIDLEWQGITDAKANSFMDDVVNARAPVFLYDQNDYLLNGKTLMPCRVISATVTKQPTGNNRISAIFAEFI